MAEHYTTLQLILYNGLVTISECSSMKNTMF
jgi:hypothetical protein